MRRIFRLLVVLVIVVVAGLLIAPNFIPMDVYKTQITRAAENATGRALVINGDLKLAFFPQFRIELNDVTFANAEGASPADMATMEQLSLGLAVLPLITERRVVIDSFVMKRPTIVMDMDRRGHGNWEFDIATNEDAPAEGDNDANGGFFLNEVNLGDVRLVDGDVTYRDARSGASYHLQDIDLTVSLPTLAGPLGLDGQLTYNGERLNLDTTIATPRDFIDGNATPVNLALRSGVVQLEFDGTAAMATSGALPFRAGGEVDLNVPSVRRLSAWQGSEISSPGGFGPMRITGRADASGNQVDFSGATLSFDDMAGTGNFALNLAGARPRMNGDLALNKLDVRPYMGDGSTRARPRGNASSEWSTDPIDFAALRAFDMDLNIVAEEVLTTTLKMGRSVVDVNLRNGVMIAELAEMALYDGGGTARFEVDARNAEAIIRQQATISVIQALPLFTDLANFRSLEGIGNITVDVTTRGRSQRDFISALNGSGEIRFNDGALKGINIANLLRSVSSALTGVATESGPQQTDFAELGGTFDIRNGVVSNVDMRLLNPLLRVTGAGNTNLLERTIEYRIDPQAVMSLEGQGSTRDLTGMTVPLLISGTWDDMQFGPDMAAIGQNVLQNLLGGGDTDEALAQPGSIADGTEEEPADGVNAPAENLLQNLFGRERSDDDQESQQEEEQETVDPEPAATEPEPVVEEEAPAPRRRRVREPVEDPPAVEPESEPIVEEPASAPTPDPEPAPQPEPEAEVIEDPAPVEDPAQTEAPAPEVTAVEETPEQEARRLRRERRERRRQERETGGGD